MKNTAIVFFCMIITACASTPKQFASDEQLKLAFPSIFTNEKKSLTCQIEVKEFSEADSSNNQSGIARMYGRKLQTVEIDYLKKLSYKLEIKNTDTLSADILVSKNEGLPLPFDETESLIQFSLTDNTDQSPVLVRRDRIANSDIKSIGHILAITYLKNFTSWRSADEKQLVPGGYEYTFKDSGTFHFDKIIVRENLKSFEINSTVSRTQADELAVIKVNKLNGLFPVPTDISEIVPNYGSKMHYRYFIELDENSKPPLPKSIEVRADNYQPSTYYFKNCRLD